MPVQIKREERADKELETTTTTTGDSAPKKANNPCPSQQYSRSHSRRRVVSYTGQTDPDINEATPALELLRRRQEDGHNSPTQDSSHPSPISPPPVSYSPPSQPISTIPSSPLSPEQPTADPLNTIAGTATLARPATGGKAFPFKLGTHLEPEGRNASMVTLTSQMAVTMPTPKAEGLGKQLGEEDRMGKGNRPELERFETAVERL